MFTTKSGRPQKLCKVKNRTLQGNFVTVIFGPIPPCPRRTSGAARTRLRLAVSTWRAPRPRPRAPRRMGLGMVAGCRNPDPGRNHSIIVSIIDPPASAAPLPPLRLPFVHFETICTVRGRDRDGAPHLSHDTQIQPSDSRTARTPGLVARGYASGEASHTH